MIFNGTTKKKYKIINNSSAVFPESAYPGEYVVARTKDGDFYLPSLRVVGVSGINSILTTNPQSLFTQI